MTREDVLQELIAHLASDGDGLLCWEQVRHWPDGAVAIFEKAGWLTTAEPASNVECPGCEEGCFMNAHVLPAAHGQPERAYVACDHREGMGRVAIPLANIQQWQITEARVARWTSRELGLKSEPERNRHSGTIQIGTLVGKKRTACLDLVLAEPVSLRASGHSLPLSELVLFDGDRPTIDRNAIVRLVDLPIRKDGYRPSTARRDARTLATEERNEKWRKAHRELKRSRPNMSDVWYSQQIAKMPIAQGKTAETIRKQLGR